MSTTNPQNSNRNQFVVFGIIFVLLIALGYISLENVDTIADFQELVSGSSVGQVVELSSEPAVNSEPADTDTDIEDPPPPDVDLSAQDPLDTDDEPIKEPDASLNVLGSNNDTFFLSSYDPVIHIQLKAEAPVNEAAESSVDAKFYLVSTSASPDDLLSTSFSSEVTENIGANAARVNIDIPFADLPPTGEYKGWLIVSGDDIEPLSKEYTVKVVNHTSGSEDISLSKIFLTVPGIGEDADKKVYLVREYGELEVTLQNLNAESEINLTVEALIPGYDSGYVGTDPAKPEEISLGEMESKNITLTFSNLPPEGEYDTLFFVKGNGNQLLVTQEKLVITSNTDITIKHQLSDDASQSISLVGIRNKPAWWGGSETATVDWTSYSLKLWEEHLRGTGCKIFASELANSDTGYTIELTPGDCPNNGVDYPVTIVIKPEDSDYPAGTYHGNLYIYLEEGSTLQTTIPLTAKIRDQLIWPGLVIFLGTLLLGWAIRYGLGNALENVAYLKSLISQAEYLLNTQYTGNDVSEIKTYILRAKYNLIVNDTKQAKKNINKAFDKMSMGGLKTEADFTERLGRVSSWIKTYIIDWIRLSLTSLVSIIVWALIATVAGLIYIGNLLPTFGSPMDYLLALAWALGLSTISKPTESMAAAILKSLTKQEPVAGSNAAGGKPGDQGATPNDDNSDQPALKTVPVWIQNETMATNYKKALENNGITNYQFKKDDSEVNELEGLVVIGTSIPEDEVVPPETTLEVKVTVDSEKTGKETGGSGEEASKK